MVGARSSSEKISVQSAPPLRAPVGALLFFAWVLVVQLIGLAVFTKGFFLTRVELGLQSQCDIRKLLTENEFDHLSDEARLYAGEYAPSHVFEQDGGTNGCWLPSRFKRVVWVVIDALRFDFAAYSPPKDQEGRGPHHAPGARHYLNHLPVIHEAITGGESRSPADGGTPSEFEGTGGMLFQFEADPPTVTMQRLKGLTTGGLPTFIDFRDNFHSPEIAEDNWVAQVKARAARLHGRNSARGNGGERESGGGSPGGELVFMGDDTWTSLYPTYFTRSFPFPSFNTRDLHTVDDGVLGHLPDELGKTDWDVLVAHFLGVDHVGHTFGPASQAMADKLDQMNTALRKVFSSVDDETVVFVLGDHGMTEDGNHGGATPEETGAALLVWSRSAERLLGSAEPPRETETSARQRNPITWGGNGVAEEHGDTQTGSGSVGTVLSSRKIAQIDLVPTVSLLLGTPIPFGSLGGIIPELFSGRYLFEAGGDGGENGGGGGRGRSSGQGTGIRYLERLCDAFLVNSVQVWRYLSEYAKVASMPKEDMHELEELLRTARDQHTLWKKKEEESRRSHTANSVDDLRAVCDKYRDFLDASIGLGRALWTQYDTGLMCWGLAVLLLATVALLARVTVLAVLSSSSSSASVASPDAESSGHSPRLFKRVRGRPGVSIAWQADGTRGQRPGVGYFGVFWGGAGLAGTLLGDAVFGPSGTHVVLAKVASCSCLGVCWYYVETFNGYRCALSTAATLKRLSFGGKESDGPKPSIGGTKSSAVDDSSSASASTSTAASVMPGFLALLYCAGLFSNSFIEAEDGLHRFLGASALLVLAALLAVATASPRPIASLTPSTTPAGTVTSSDANFSVENDSSVGPGFVPRRFLPAWGLTGAAWYGILAAVCLRLAAAAQDFHSGAVGVSPGAAAAFSVAGSIMPLIALWFLCLLACCNDADFLGNRGTFVAEIVGFRSRPRGKMTVRPSGEEGSGWRSSSWLRFAVVHSLLQGISLVAIGLYWAYEASTGMMESANSPSPATAEGGSTPPGGHLSSFPFPLRLLLPRVTYTLCLVGFIVTVVGPARRMRLSSHTSSNDSTNPTTRGRVTVVEPMRRMISRSHTSSHDSTNPTARGRDPAEPALGVAATNLSRETYRFNSNAAADDLFARTGVGAYADVSVRAAARIITHLVPVVVLLLGPGSPPIILLLAMSCAFVLRGVSVAARSGVAIPLGAVAVAWSVVGRALFFLTGHHNQFNRLQYSAAFIGFDKFDFRVAGLLLFLNTFGTEILAAFTLPLAAAAAATRATTATNLCASDEPRPEASTEPSPYTDPNAAPSKAASHGEGGARARATSGGEKVGFWSGGEQFDSASPAGEPLMRLGIARGYHAGEVECSNRERRERVLSATFLDVMERLSGLTLLLSAARTFLSAANVSVQRGHLMLWAVFAPKFVFDATMQAVSGTAAVAAWAVVVASIRAHNNSDSDGYGGRRRPEEEAGRYGRVSRSKKSP